MKPTTFYNICDKKNSRKYLSLKPLKNEVLKYIRTRKIDGASSHIYVEGELGSFNKEQLIGLFSLYLEGELREWDLEYILQWLKMSELEFDDEIENIIFIFSVPEINYPISKKNITHVLQLLKGENTSLNFKDTSFKIDDYRSIFE